MTTKSENQSDQRGPLIFISAAEASADLHGASLMRATYEQCPSARFVGVAGPRMVAAGCRSIFDMSSHAAMLTGIISSAGRGIRMLNTIDKYLRRFRFDAAVVIDSPVLHLPVVAKAQAAGIPTLYYIAPQMWAWGTYRIHKLRDRVDGVAVILPFEEAFFRSHGIDATYVGHPLADAVADRPPNQDVVNSIRQKGSPVIPLLPGSRKQVVASILPDQLAVSERIAEKYPQAVFQVSVASPQVLPIVEEAISHCRCRVEVSSDRHTELIVAADLVLVASGTTTLEVAFYEKPMIVMYQASRLFYHAIGRWMIHTPYLSLPNILAGSEIVPEFMPYYSSIDPIVDKALLLLGSSEARVSMSEALRNVVAPMRNTHASATTAKLLLKIIKDRGH